MSNNILPVFETVEFLRVVTYGEGKRGKFAVAIVRREQNEYTTLFAEEQFPLEQVNVLKEGQIIKVRPSEYGLRAVLKDQDIELLAQNQEDLAIAFQRFITKFDNFENRSVARDQVSVNEIRELKLETKDLRQELERVKAVIICAYANDEND